MLILLAHMLTQSSGQSLRAFHAFSGNVTFLFKKRLGFPANGARASPSCRRQHKE